MSAEKNLVKANIDLLDKNKMLERDIKILSSRINKAMKVVSALKNKVEEKEQIEELEDILKNG